ncbi:MAG: 23S rRNA (guanosine(2251)-2'-O)-methyltransferase RlmB [Beijerinckiaceae bacterium]|nr:23S rRNA (guanosine(2251)-2'-O)-methyltransferase RlmB [Beijerinckiaceae bacterium]
MMAKRFDKKRNGSADRPPHDRGREDRPRPAFKAPFQDRPARSERPRSGRPVIYGFHAVIEALKNPRRKALVLHVTENALKRLMEEMPDLPIAPIMAKPDEIDRITGPDAVHQGVALEADGLPAADIHDLEGKGVVIVLDQVTDPHNVGAILRTAAAFAAEAVLVTERNSPEAVGVLAKAASGGLEHVPLIEVVNLAQALTLLGEKGYWRVGLDSEGPNVLAESLANPPIALVMGAEGKGLRRLTRERCDVLARLDMPGAIKSLNVSNAVAIALATVIGAIKRP